MGRLVYAFVSDDVDPDEPLPDSALMTGCVRASGVPGQWYEKSCIIAAPLVVEESSLCVITERRKRFLWLRTATCTAGYQAALLHVVTAGMGPQVMLRGD